MTIRKEQKDFQSIREWDIDFSDYTVNISLFMLPFNFMKSICIS